MPAEAPVSSVMIFPKEIRFVLSLQFATLALDDVRTLYESNPLFGTIRLGVEKVEEDMGHDIVGILVGTRAPKEQQVHFASSTLVETDLGVFSVPISYVPYS